MRHYIILSSSYSKGTRIGLHFAGNELSTHMPLINNLLNTFSDRISVHSLETAGNTFADVVAYDAFFCGVSVITNVDEFIRLIKLDQTLVGQNIIEYALAVKDVSADNLLAMLRQTFLVYKELYSAELFTDYTTNECNGYDFTQTVDNYLRLGRTKPQHTQRQAFRSRILFSYDGVRKLKVIDDVLESIK